MVAGTNTNNQNTHNNENPNNNLKPNINNQPQNYFCNATKQLDIPVHAKCLKINDIALMNIKYPNEEELNHSCRVNIKYQILNIKLFIS